MLHSSRRAKGNTLEYDCEYNLKKKYPDIQATERRGFVTGYDLVSKFYGIYVECKRHQSFTWNELVAVYKQLTDRTPDATWRYLIFQPNRQPVLVYDGIAVKTYQDFFKEPFEKRPRGWSRNEPRQGNTTGLG